jgi:hypothetical protein
MKGGVLFRHDTPTQWTASRPLRPAHFMTVWRKHQAITDGAALAYALALQKIRSYRLLELLIVDRAHGRTGSGTNSWKNGSGAAGAGDRFE